MASGNKKRTRSEHVASLELPPGRFGQMFASVQRPDVLLRLGLCVLAALAMFLVTGAWAPPFAYRSGYIPPRDIVARIEFEFPDEGARDRLREQAARNIRCVYENDGKQLKQLRQELNSAVAQLVSVDAYGELPAHVWDRFFHGAGDEGKSPSSNQQAEAFESLQAALADEAVSESFDKAVERAMADFEGDGLLEEVSLHTPDQGNQKEIGVHPLGDEQEWRRVRVEDVYLGQAIPRLRQRLAKELGSVIADEVLCSTIVERVHCWLAADLPPTLTLNEEATKEVRDAARKAVPKQMKRYHAGDVLAPGGIALTASLLEERLRPEHAALVRATTPLEVLYRCLADFGMFAALYTLCGVYFFYRERRLLKDLRQFVTLLGLVVATVALSRIGAEDEWRVEIIPILVFGMTLTIAYRHEVALLLSAAVSLVVVLSLGQGIADFVVLVAASATSVQLLGRIRSRTKLIYVGLATAVVAMLSTVGVGALTGQFLQTLASAGLWIGICTFLAAVLMTGLLPFIERLFDVQTELSLLELGDAAHPLLQELVRRAPGTYNHSINVASIAEAAAEAIGANGLLARVGSYFHDIGKLLKPEYFIENQGLETNRHESLVPAMSTLIIIAHVKDGADLARQHGLPNSVIDFILQHHGTTLVEFFYDQAHQQSKADPDGGIVDESSFRYPGPRPQTKETAVMMLADAVESASRTLVDPTPARIESVVHEIAMKRLLDDQFDECGLTFSELRTVQDALVKSLAAVYHGRVKYPEQQETA